MIDRLLLPSFTAKAFGLFYYSTYIEAETVS